jgi:hypothetical protein
MPPRAAVRQAELLGQVADVIHHRISLVAGLLPNIARPAPMVQRVPHVSGRGIAVNRRQPFVNAKQCREEADEAIGKVASYGNHLAIWQWLANQRAVCRDMMLVGGLYRSARERANDHYRWQCSHPIVPNVRFSRRDAAADDDAWIVACHRIAKTDRRTASLVLTNAVFNRS